MEWKDYKKEILKHPGVKKEYDRLRPEFELAKSIIEARIKQKMTQEEVARKAGVPQSTVARIEGLSTGIPRLSTLEKIAEALGFRLHITLEPKHS